MLLFNLLKLRGPVLRPNFRLLKVAARESSAPKPRAKVVAANPRTKLVEANPRAKVAGANPRAKLVGENLRAKVVDANLRSKRADIVGRRKGGGQEGVPIIALGHSST
jgi:hypothetical protein